MSGGPGRPPAGTHDAGAPPAANCTTGTDSGNFFPCDVEAILAAKCRRCHTTEAELDVCAPKKTCARAPFPLLVWSDTRLSLGDGVTPLDLMADVIASDFMPLQDESLSPPVETLTPAEKATLLGWVKACGVPGARACLTR